MSIKGRELVRKVLMREEVERLPRDLWSVPYIPMFRQDELARFFAQYPMDLTGPAGIAFGNSRYSAGTPYIKNQKYTDEFGCEWEVLEDGVAGEIKNPIIKTQFDLDSYKMPWEILDGMKWENQTQAYKDTDLFVVCGSHVRPFERLQFMRGSEQLFIDIALEDPVFLKLKDMLHEFYVRELKLLAPLALDGISFIDDWGSQKSLLISPEAWRKHFKPMYQEYCDIIHSFGKFVFFHSDGHTEAIYDDIVEIGVDAYNSQLFCMDIEKLAEKYKGKITFWGELDRQNILPFGTEEEVRESVRRIKRAMLTPKRTGFIAELSWETVTPLSNVIAAYDEFDKI